METEQTQVQTKQILFLEPYATQRLLYASVLKKSDRWTVSVFDQAAKAENYLIAYEQEFDLLVSHIHYPDGNGGRDYKQIADLCNRAIEKRPEIRIILLDGQNLPEETLDKLGFPKKVRRFHYYFEKTQVFLDMIEDALSDVAREN